VEVLRAWRLFCRLRAPLVQSVPRLQDLVFSDEGVEPGSADAASFLSLAEVFERVIQSWEEERDRPTGKEE